MDVSAQHKTACRRSTDQRHKYLLSRQIKDLNLEIPGTPLEALINKLYCELEKAGISFKPETYLSDEWGCPEDVPVIGIPFYLVDLELCTLEGKMTGIEAENDAEVMMYLRHEAGHAFNYAYRLYDEAEWQQTFGSYSQPYRENYSASPFSARFVRNVPGWYAQKHPDEDFAETFAVWLNPGSNWKRVYEDTAALKKLSYVERIARRYGGKPPLAIPTRLDKPVQELAMTLDTWYKTNQAVCHPRPELNPVIDEDLRRLLPGKKGRKAANIILANRGAIIHEVNFWTGLERHIMAALFDELLDRIKALGLNIETEQITGRLISVVAFLTTLASNYQLTGKFMQE